MSGSVGVIWDACFLDHNAGDYHPERPERLIAIRQAMQPLGLWSRLTPLEVREAERHELERGHTPEHVEKVFAADGKPQTFFDGDTIASPGTTKAALRAAGGAIDLAKAVYHRDVDKGFSLARPPGHHAERERAMGFCYFNNIALAAYALLEEVGLERVMIVDWDVHHGNGTQHTFESDDRVMFVSLHQSPFYPGTGLLEETGKGKGEGYTVNFPLGPGLGDADYLYCFEEVLRPLTHAFAPQMILLSAGYDAHRRDPLGSMKLTGAGFAAMAKELCSLAESCCEGRLAAFLEGGYDLEGLSEGVLATFQVFLQDEVEMTESAKAAGPFARHVCQDLKNLFGEKWSL